MATVAVVRYGAMDRMDCFSVSEGNVQPGNDVILRTQRGVEWGQIVSVRERQPDERKPAGEVLRKATPSDYDRQRDITERRQLEERRTCKRLILKHKLPIKLVSVEHLFGGHKIIFYFVADGRVDFRQLVKDLAKEYRTRIELRQIGVRDEARLLGQVGPCGQELCCRTFLTALKPVPMKLAKDQKSTLDPAKISGTCGRLKCCLKFEEELYRELKEKLPRRGTRVKTASGEGIVVDYEIIPQTVEVQFEDGVRQKFHASEVAQVQRRQ